MRRRTTKCRRDKRYCLPLKLHFYADKFYLNLCREHPKGWILRKPQVQTTSKRMQHNVELFLSSELGHSPKRNVKLLGREQRSDFHHNWTTLSRHVGLSLFLSVSVSHSEVSIYRKQVSNLSDNAPRVWKLYLCRFLIMGAKRATFMAKRLQASFSYSLMCHSSKTEGYLA